MAVLLRRCEPRLMTYTLMVMIMFLLGGVVIHLQQLTTPKNVLSMSENRHPRVLYRFWSAFLLWDLYKPPYLGPDPPHTTDRYWIYHCDMKSRACGGWADRLKGIIAGYLLANLTGRLFKVQISRPKCELGEYLIPNKVNWSYPVREFPPDESTYVKYQFVDNKRFKGSVQGEDFNKTFDQNKKLIYFIGNLEYVSGLLKNPRYSSELSWTRGLSPADVYAAVYKRLFRLHPRLQQRLERIISETLASPRHRLVCIHVRMGSTTESFVDTSVRNNLTNLPRIWKFISRNSRSEFDRVFVMSDSNDVLESARNQSFGNKLVTIPGRIVHMDRTHRRLGGRKTEEMCSGFEKLLLEHHLLMNCDVMVRGHSGLSVIASAIRGTDKDLYCLMRNGTITPCVRNDFSTFL